MKALPYEAIPEAEIQTHIPTAELFPISPEHIAYTVPLGALNVANQMRPDGDYGDILELAQSIKAVGVKQPVRAFRWDAEIADTYLQLNNRLYPEKDARDISNFTPLDDGSYLVLVYGHRRLLASQLAARDEIPAQIIEDGKIAEALEDQTVENIYHPPEPYSFARSINEVYNLQLAAGMVNSQAEFARKCGVGPDRLRSALRFCSLPLEVQQIVIDGNLSYKKAVEVARLIPAIKEYERNNTEGEAPPEEYLDFIVRGDLAKHVAYIRDKKLTYPMTTAYVRGKMIYYVGGRELSLLDDEARRNLQVETIRRRTREKVNEALHSLGNVALGVRIAEMTDEEALVYSKITEPGMQRVLGELASAVTLLGRHVGYTRETRDQATEVAEAIQQLLTGGAGTEVDESAEEPQLRLA